MQAKLNVCAIVCLVFLIGCDSDTQWKRVTTYDSVFFVDSTTLLVLWRTYEYKGNGGNAWAESDTRNARAAVGTYDITDGELVTEAVLTFDGESTFPLRAVYASPWLVYVDMPEQGMFELWKYSVEVGSRQRIGGPWYRDVALYLVSAGGRYLAYGNTPAEVVVYDLTVDSLICRAEFGLHLYPAALSDSLGVFYYQLLEDTGLGAYALGIPDLDTIVLGDWGVQVYRPVDYGRQVLVQEVPLTSVSPAGVMAVADLANTPTMTVLPGLPTTDPEQLDLDFDAGLYAYCDVLEGNIFLGDLQEPGDNTIILTREEESLLHP